MKIVLGLSLIIGIILALQWRDNVDKKLEAVEINNNADFVDAYMKNFVLTGMNEKGQPSYTLEASQLDHYNKSTITFITHPKFRFINADSKWLITANKGKIDDKQSEVTLTENVKMVQKDVLNPIQLETETLNINTESQLAKSNSHIIIKQNNFNLTAQGMIFNSKSGMLQLLTKVNGVYNGSK